MNYKNIKIKIMIASLGVFFSVKLFAEEKTCAGKMEQKYIRATAVVVAASPVLLSGLAIDLVGIIFTLGIPVAWADGYRQYKNLLNAATKEYFKKGTKNSRQLI